MPTKKKQKVNTPCPYANYFWRSDSDLWKPKDSLSTFGQACANLVAAGLMAEQDKWSPMIQGDIKSLVWCLYRFTFATGKPNSELLAIWDANGVDDDAVSTSSSPLYVNATIEKIYDAAAAAKKKAGAKTLKKAGKSNYVGGGQVWIRDKVFPERWSGEKLLKVFRTKFKDAQFFMEPQPVWNSGLHRFVSPTNASLCIKMLKHEQAVFKWSSNGKIALVGLQAAGSAFFTIAGIISWFEEVYNNGGDEDITPPHSPDKPLPPVNRSSNLARTNSLTSMSLRPKIESPVRFAEGPQISKVELLKPFPSDFFEGMTEQIAGERKSVLAAYESANCLGSRNDQKRLRQITSFNNLYDIRLSMIPFWKNGEVGREQCIEDAMKRDTISSKDAAALFDSAFDGNFRMVEEWADKSLKRKAKVKMKTTVTSTTTTTSTQESSFQLSLSDSLTSPALDDDVAPADPDLPREQLLLSLQHRLQELQSEVASKKSKLPLHAPSLLSSDGGSDGGSDGVSRGNSSVAGSSRSSSSSSGSSSGSTSSRGGSSAGSSSGTVPAPPPLPPSPTFSCL